MKRKILTLLLAACAAMCLCFGLAACDTKTPDDSGDTEHTHTYAESWTSDANYHWHAATCGHDSVSGKAAHSFVNGVCTVCGYDNSTGGVTEHTHDYQWVNNGDGTHKQHCVNDGCDEPDINVGAHVWGADGKCTVCGALKPAEEHTHDYQWVDNGDGTHKQHCVNDGCNEPDINVSAHVWGADGKCTVCGAVKPIEEHTHVWSQTYEYNDTHHWHNCTADGCPITDNSQKEGYAEHVYVNGVCACGKEEEILYTQGLEYEFDSLGSVYTVTGLGEVTETDIIIPDSYEGYPVKYIGESAFAGTAITSIKFGKNITTVEANAFSDCTELRSVDINPRCYLYFGGCFKNCTSLTRIELPGVNATAQLSSGIFKGCTAIEYIDLGNARVLPVNTFNGCSSLKTLVADSLTSIIDDNGTFTGCTNLSTFAIPDKVELIKGSWFEDTKLITVSGNIKYVDTWAVGFVDGEQATAELSFRSGTTGIYAYAFENANVTDVYIPSTLKHVYGRFGNNVKNIHLTDLEAYLSLKIDDYGLVSSSEYDTYRMYLNGEELTDLVIPSTITEIPASAFYNCQSLQKVTIHSGVTNIGNYAFRYCKNIEYTEYKNGKYIGETGGALVLVGMIDTTAASFEFAPNTVAISESAFQSSAIESITVPDSVKLIGESAFSSCKSLTSVILPDGLTEIAEQMFRGCTSLSDITVPDSVTVIRGGAFYGCSALTKLPFGTNSRLETIDNEGTQTGFTGHLGAFAGSGLQEISFPETLTYIGSYAFYNCTSFEELTIGSSVTYIGSHAFENCKMTTLVIDGTSETEIGPSAFYGCRSLQSADIKVRFINTSAFTNCASLSDLTLREGVQTIAYLVFSYDTSLVTVTLPSTLISIQKDAFSGCSRLVEVQNLSALSITTEEISSARLFRDKDTPTAIFKEDGFVFFRDAAAGKTYLLMYEGNETEVTLPEVEGGYELFPSAFASSAFVKVTIPEGVTVISDLAFNNSKSLSEVYIPASVESISTKAFSLCDNLTKLEIDENNAYYSFKDGILYDSDVTQIIWVFPTLSGRVVIPGTVSQIPSSAFDMFEDITEVVLSEGVTTIGGAAFIDCTSLESVVLPKSLESIGMSAFNGCTELEAIYYNGTAEDWGKISIRVLAITIPNTATIYYFSEEEPQSEGNYWHYDADGVTPVVWGVETATDTETETA